MTCQRESAIRGFIGVFRGISDVGNSSSGVDKGFKGKKSWQILQRNGRGGGKSADPSIFLRSTQTYVSLLNIYDVHLFQ